LYDANSNKIYEGNFDNGKYSGAGIESYPGKSIKYNGNFQNGYYDGNGILFDESGNKIYEGTFKEGMYNQSGKLYGSSGKLSYDGEFNKGKPEGIGTVYDDSENIVFKGYFKEGKIFYQGFLGLSQDKLKIILGDPDQIVVTPDSLTTINYSTYKISLILNNIETMEQPVQQNQQTGINAQGQQAEQGSSPQTVQQPQAQESKTYKVIRIRIYEDPEILIKKELLPDNYGKPSDEKSVTINDINMKLKEYVNDSYIFSFYYNTRDSKLNYLEISKQNGHK
jgi:hypothetical protein